MKKVTNTIKSASSIIAILAISAFSFNTFASEVESNKSYSCVETATENSCNLIITNPTAEDKKLVETWKQKVEFSTCSVETAEKIECNITAYYEDLEKEISEQLNGISVLAHALIIAFSLFIFLTLNWLSLMIGYKIYIIIIRIRNSIINKYESINSKEDV